MPGYQDRIQGTDRLLRIRRIRNAVFAGLLALTAVLIFLRMEGEGGSLKPFFFPVNAVFEIGLIMGLIAAVVALFLRNLEIQHVQRDKQRYVMAKSSMNRAIRTAGFAIGLAMVLLLAFAPSLAAALFSDPPQAFTLEPNGREVVTFTSPDSFGVSFVTHAVVTVTQGEASVEVMRDNVTMDSALLATSDRISLDVEPAMWESHANWSLVFRNPGTATTYLRFVLEKAVMPTLFSTVPFLLFLYGGIQVGWWVTLRPVRERTKTASRYAVRELGDGERMYEDALTPTAPTDASAGTADLRVAAAPPPPPTTVPPPPPATAPAPAAAEVPPSAPRAAVRTPETPVSLVSKAEALIAAGSIDAALSAYEGALRLDSAYGPALLGRAACDLHMGRRAEALDAYRTILASDAGNLEALRAIARLHAEDRRWRECLEAVDDLLRLRPNEPSALERRGDALTNLGRRAEALSAYEGAAALDPSNENLRQKIEEVRVDVPGLLSRALIASASGNYPQALNLFDDILEIDPSNVNAFIGKAVAYRRSGKPQEALNCLDLVLGVQPNNASALLNRGNILLEAGDPDTALDSFDQLTTLYPNDEEAWAAQGEVLVKMGRDDDALRAFTEALKLSPGDEAIQRRILELEAAKAVEADILEELLRVKGIGKARAKALIDAGFQTSEAFARATPKELMAVRGVTRKIADDLTEHFQASLAEAR